VTSAGLAGAFTTVADRIGASSRAGYVEWLCLPKQGAMMPPFGTNDVSIGVVAPKSTPAKLSLPALHAAATCFQDFTAQRKAHPCGGVLAGVCADGKFCDKTGSCQDFLVRPGDSLLACITLSSCKLFPGTANQVDPNQCLYVFRRELQAPGTWAYGLGFDEIRCLANSAGDCAAAAACVPPCPAGKNNGDVYCVGTESRVCDRSFGMIGMPPPNGPSAEWRHPCGASNGTCSGGGAPACNSPADNTCLSGGTFCTADGAAQVCHDNLTAFTSRCDKLEFSRCETTVGCGADCSVDNASCAGQNVLIACGRPFDCTLAGYSRCEAQGPFAHCVP